MSYKICMQAVHIVAISTAGFVSGCATRVEPISYSSSSSPSNEIMILESSLDMALKNQVDVLAPKTFSSSLDYYEKAKDQSVDAVNPAKIFDSLGYSQAYLNRAVEEASKTRGLFTGLLEARASAARAGRENFGEQFDDLDDDFSDLTKDYDSAVSVSESEKVALRDEYLALELRAIKQLHLSVAQNLLRASKDKGAEDITPQAYTEAVQKLNQAEKTIEVSRHDSLQIEEASKEAVSAALRVERLLDTALLTTEQSPEQRARALEAQDREIRIAEQQVQYKDERLDERNREFSEAQGELSSLSARNQQLSQDESDRQLVSEAAAKFEKEEADVYVQEGDLVIRLKKINFATGRSDLPASSLVTLAKVKEIIKQLQAKHVKIEGHTDSMGSAALNKALSKDRAQIVAKHLVVEEVLTDDQVESEGFGFTKPIASNKTKSGRAQNRRVDVLIATGQNTLDQ